MLATEYRLRDGVSEVFPKGFRFEVIAGLDGGPKLPIATNSIALDEQSEARRVNLRVWTGTAQDMSTHPAHCEDWNAVTGVAAYGLLGSTVSPDIFSHSPNDGAGLCTEGNHVYCFEVP